MHYEGNNQTDLRTSNLGERNRNSPASFADMERLSFSHNSFRETSLSDLETSEKLYQAASEPMMDARRRAGVERALNGTETVSTVRQTANEPNALQNRSNETNYANRENRSDSTTANRAATDSQTPPSEGGAGAVASEFLTGAGDALTVTRVATGVAIGAAVGLAAIGIASASVAAAAVIGAGALAYGAYSFVSALPGWFRDAKIVANPNQYTQAEVSRARSGIRSIGAGTVDLAAGAIGAPIGSITANALRPAATSASLTVAEAFSTGRTGEVARGALNTVTSRAGELKTSLTTHLSDASFAVSKRATDLYNSYPAAHAPLESVGGAIKSIGMPVINGASGITSSISRVAEGVKSIATPTESQRSAMLSIAERGRQRAESAVLASTNGLNSAGNAYISVFDRGVALGNSAIANAKPHIETAITAAKPYAESARATARDFSSRVVNGTVDNARSLYSAERTQNALRAMDDAYSAIKASGHVASERFAKFGTKFAEDVALARFEREAVNVLSRSNRLPAVAQVYDSTSVAGAIVKSPKGQHYFLESQPRGHAIAHALESQQASNGTLSFRGMPAGFDYKFANQMNGYSIHVPATDQVKLSTNSLSYAKHQYDLAQRGLGQLIIG